MNLDLWVEGFKLALAGENLLYLVLGTFIGLIVGALPGLGPIFGVALMLPFTFSLPPATAIIFLVAIHAATVYGDSIASILINTPGGAGSIASCWDGYPLAKQGKTGMALGISAFCSVIGGVVGWGCLVLISPLLVMVALKIGAAEYFFFGHPGLVPARCGVTRRYPERLVCRQPRPPAGLCRAGSRSRPIPSHFRISVP